METEQAERESRLTSALREELWHLRHLVRRARLHGVAEADIFDRVFDALGFRPSGDELSCIVAVVVAREIRRELRGEKDPTSGRGPAE